MKRGVILLMSVVFGLIKVCLAEVTTAAAEEEAPTFKLGEVVVTATRTEEISRDVPASVVVITGKEIKESQAKFISNVLEGIPGVSISSTDALGRGPTITLRGVYDYNSGYVLVLVNGMPINSPDTGKPYIDSIPLSDIERIEIIKGGNSAVWGGYAMGGVINIITKEGGKTSAEAYASQSAWNTKIFDFSGQISFSNDVYFHIVGDSRATDGWRKHSDYNLKTFGGSLTKYNKEKSLKTSLKFGYYKDHNKYPGPLTKKQWEEGNLTAWDPNYWRASGKQENKYIQLVTKKSISSTLSGIFNLSYFKKGFTFYDRLQGGSAEVNDVDVFRGSLQLNGGTAKRKFTVGLDIGKGTVGSRNYGADVDSEIINKNILNEYKDMDIYQYAFYAQSIQELHERWNLHMGVRYDSLKHNITDMIKSKKYKCHLDAVSPNLGLVFKATPNLNLFGTVSKAFKSPTESQLAQNSELKPEKGLNKEIGVKLFANKMSWELSVYQMHLTDKITYKPVEPNKWELRNVGKVNYKGIELASNIDIFKGFSVSFAGDITRSEIRKDPKYPETIGKNVSQVPLWKVSLGLKYKTDKGFGARADLYKIGPWYMDDKNQKKYPGYFRTDLKFSLDKTNASYYLSIDNVFNAKYCRKAYISRGKELYWPATPRAFWVGVEVKF